MGSYLGRHAELYDLFYQDKLYPDEAQFIHEIIIRHGIGGNSRLLDLACGTGSHAFEFEKLGYNVTAIDHSEDMLSVARKKANAVHSQVEFVKKDMCTLNLRGHEFDTAICLFD